MGISIHYRGTLADKKNIYQLIEEIRDIAQVNGWAYTCRDESWHHPSRCTPGKCKRTRNKNYRKLCVERLTVPARFYTVKPSGFISIQMATLLTPFRVALDAEEGYPARKNLDFHPNPFCRCRSTYDYCKNPEVYQEKICT